MIRFDRSLCRDLEAASRREWLETNGLGGYASSTVAGMNTRRYHGLLVAATRPPVGRMVLLAKMEETLVAAGRRYELSANRYPGVVHPQGYLWLREFRLDPHPVFVYECGGVELEKAVFMVPGENATVIQYRWTGQAEKCLLELRPLIAFRDYHATTHANAALRADVEIGEGSVKVEPYEGLPALYLLHRGGRVERTGFWYRDFEYDRERERGLDYREDLFQPFVLELKLPRDERAPVIASVASDTFASDAFASVSVLSRAADQFLVKRGAGMTVIAGYHWFTDWGRDTMIALPGLTLATGRPEVAREILLSFAAVADRGMLPNRFPDTGEAPEYNTVDATLWFFEAVRAYAERTGDFEFVRSRLYDALADIVSWHERGTRYGIRMDADGLILAGEPGVALTWMDAKVDDWVVTPRHGKPVEIQALWYNALRTMEELALQFGDSAGRGRYRGMAERAQAAFSDLFWNAAEGCLYDVVNGSEKDAAIRPNQIFAVSLSYKLLDRERARMVVATVRRHLLTPFGLRTLAPSDPQYRGRYEGDRRSRDGAYHQGTVWPWLLGPFLQAYVEANGGAREAFQQAAEWLAPLTRFLHEEGCGQLPEVFDGDPPHRPAGAIAQAWSVAEVLRWIAPLVAAGYGDRLPYKE